MQLTELTGFILNVSLFDKFLSITTINVPRSPYWCLYYADNHRFAQSDLCQTFSALN